MQRASKALTPADAPFDFTLRRPAVAAASPLENVRFAGTGIDEATVCEIEAWLDALPPNAQRKLYRSSTVALLDPLYAKIKRARDKGIGWPEIIAEIRSHVDIGMRTIQRYYLNRRRAEDAQAAGGVVEKAKRGRPRKPAPQVHASGTQVPP